MGTLRRVITNAKRKRFYWSLWLTFAGVLAFVSTILGISGGHLSAWQFAVLTAAALLAAVIINRRQLLDVQLSVDDVLPQTIDSSFSTKISCPSTPSEFAKAQALAANCYGASVTIEPHNFDSIRAKNPRVLACLVDDSGLFRGYFDVLPLKDGFAEMFLAGKVAEDQLTHEDIYSIPESGICRYLFISGLAVLDPDSFAGRRYASMLVWALLKYLDHFYSDANPLTFAVAATKEGNDLLSRFRLNLAGVPEARADHYGLYSLRLSKEEISLRVACLPDWSGLCKLDWVHPSALSLKQRRPTLPQLHHRTLKAAAQ